MRNKTGTQAKTTTTTVGQLHSSWALIFGRGWAGEEALIAHRKTRHVHIFSSSPFLGGDETQKIVLAGGGIVRLGPLPSFLPVLDRPNPLPDPPSLSLGHSGPKRGGRELTKEGDGRGNTGRGGGGAPPKQAGTQHQEKEGRNGEKRFDPPSPLGPSVRLSPQKRRRKKKKKKGSGEKNQSRRMDLMELGERGGRGRGKKSD